MIIRSLQDMDAERQARISKTTEGFIESAADPVEALTKRIAAVEAELAKASARMLNMMRIMYPEMQDQDHDHEWGEVGEAHHHCSCVQWVNWQDNKPGRKYNYLCRVHSS